MFERPITFDGRAVVISGNQFIGPDGLNYFPVGNIISRGEKCFGLRIRPWHDFAGVFNKVGNRTDNYKYSWDGCPAGQPGTFPLALEIYYSHGSRKMVYLANDSVYLLGDGVNTINLFVPIGGSSNQTSFPPLITPTYILTTFESKEEFVDLPKTERLSVFPLFIENTFNRSHFLIRYQDAVGNANIGLAAGGQAPLNRMNYYGINDGSVGSGTGPLLGKQECGAFYVFENYRRWRVTLQTTGLGADIPEDIYLLSTNEGTYGTSGGSPAWGFRLNEIIPASDWPQFVNPDNGHYELVLERECDFSGESILIASSSAIQYSIRLLGATMTYAI